ncbi:MAG: aspartate carbamoyltransferase catalytic subunit [Deltaproteobacteria bacterium]|nr:MAG: aspartate carbamoyltransferase catalytic subunit [Deltaproteobacteria bacterium]
MNNFPSVFEAINDLSKDQIEGLLILARKFKERDHDKPQFPNKLPIVANSFLENSTRTKNSFAIAIKRLGCHYLDFNTETSSLNKGESLEETLLTLYAQGVDLCIIRTSVSNQLSEFKNNTPVKIINGGDGTNQHPTQALLDLFTMQEIGIELEGKTMAIIGDCIHSRVGHSLCELLPQFGCNIILCGPSDYVPKTPEYEGVEISNDLESTVKRSDFLYTLRIQKERHAGSTEAAKHYDTYHDKYGISRDKLKAWNKEVPVFHPGPANIGVEISTDIIKSSLYKGYDQVVNSIYMRMAIITAILSNNDKNIGIIDGTRIRD